MGGHRQEASLDLQFPSIDERTTLFNPQVVLLFCRKHLRIAHITLARVVARLADKRLSLTSSTNALHSSLRTDMPQSQR